MPSQFAGKLLADLGVDVIKVEPPGGAASRHIGLFVEGVRTTPPHITAKQLHGFALASSKIVLSRGVGNMVEMARANLRNIPR